MEQGYIVCDPNKCTGCGICEMACSAVKEKKINPLLSRIRAVSLKSKTEPISSISFACFHCENPVCVKSCPREALSVDEETGKIVVCTAWSTGPLWLSNEEAHGCVPCGWCVTACEFGALSIHPGKKVAMVCDLCPEDRIDREPPCVKFCPKDALALSTVEEITEKSTSESVKKLLEEFSKARKDSKTFYERLKFIPIQPP